MREVAKHVFVALRNIVSYIQTCMKFNGLEMYLQDTRANAPRYYELTAYSEEQGRSAGSFSCMCPSYVIWCDINTTKNMVTFKKLSGIVFPQHDLSSDCR
jgi:hypothetical protein